jgi:uncharacterized protein with ParB-like and HNH nuclease domain
MRAGKYILNDFYSMRNFDQIIIPEIQRDYVWSEGQIIPFLNDLNNEFVKFQELKDKSFSITSNQDYDTSFLDQFKDFYIAQKHSYNVGFIYAYQDDEFPGNLFLIDGQQRFTTLYLLLLAMSVKEQKQDLFKKQYLLGNGYPRLNYRVRHAASDFLNKFIGFILTVGNADNVDKQYWYFSSNDRDATISNLQLAYKTIEQRINQVDFRVDLNYLNHHIDFWYFDTNISEQGEELYIYMNARGEAVKENENLKADLLSKLTDLAVKKDFGLKWEEWQNFFWQNKGVNHNADSGFNEFLKWISIIKACEQGDLNSQLYDNLLDGETKIAHDLLSLSEIENYYKALKYLFLEFPNIANQLENKYNGQFAIFKKMMPISWIAVEDVKLTSMSQINLFRLLPILHFVKLHLQTQKQIIGEDLYRLVRYMYNLHRYENLSKAIRESIGNAIDLATQLYNSQSTDISNITGLNISKTLLPDHERNKLHLYKTLSEEKRKEVENVFWHSEDFYLTNGSIHFLLSCVISNPNQIAQGISDAQLSEFIKVDKLFQIVYKDPSDALRQTILTFGDYLIWDGNTPVLSGQRFSFGKTDAQWISIFNHPDKSKHIRDFLIHFVQQNATAENYLSLLKARILEFNESIVKTQITKDWRFKFTVDNSALEYCQRKNICICENEDIYLLMSEKATEGNYKRL